MQDNKPHSKKFYEEVAEELIEMLKKGQAPWQKPWEANKLFIPQNALTGKPYRGMNHMFLLRNGEEDPRWMTKKQAISKGYTIAENAIARPIAFWSYTRLRTINKGTKEEDVELVNLSKPVFKRHSVYNAKDVIGLRPFTQEERKPNFDPLEKAEEIIKGVNVPIIHKETDRAYYNTNDDEIILPPKEVFKSQADYYATALHEIGHATGHEKRLKRNISGKKNSESYAREELRAEIASMMLGRELAIGHDPSQHGSYVEGWIKSLKNDPYEIERASRDAERIRDWVMCPEKRQELEQKAQGKKVEKPAVIKNDRVYLNVPYNEKEEAKQQGASWDKKAKSWYVSKDTDMSQLMKWKIIDPKALPSKSRTQSTGLGMGG